MEQWEGRVTRGPMKGCVPIPGYYASVGLFGSDLADVHLGSCMEVTAIEWMAH